MFSGTLVAMVTPFESNGAVDQRRLDEQTEFLIDSGVDGLVPVGTTGESPTLSHEEHQQVIKAVVSRAKGRVPVIAGTGSNSTEEAIHLTRYAKQVGAAGALMVNPYYNKPTQGGLYAHFSKIASNVDLPIVLYNIPGRCSVAMTPQTVARLNTDHPNIVAIKEATGSMDQASEIAATSRITILSGDDSLTLPLAAIGGRGVISVIANVVPADVKKLTDAIAANDFETAQAQHQKLFSLCRVMFIETNPIPIKAAMQMLGRDSGELRLPMTPLSEANTPIVRDTLRNYGLNVK